MHEEYKYESSFSPLPWLQRLVQGWCTLNLLYGSPSCVRVWYFISCLSLSFVISNQNFFLSLSFFKHVPGLTLTFTRSYVLVSYTFSHAHYQTFLVRPKRPLFLGNIKCLYFHHILYLVIKPNIFDISRIYLICLQD